jgi:uncharacterized membrane protein YhdT
MALRERVGKRCNLEAPSSESEIMPGNRLALCARLLFGTVALFLLLFGLLYASRTSMLFFHAAAVPEAVRPDMLELYLALMRLIGGASIGLGILGLYTVVGPLSRGIAGAATALTIAFLVPLALAAYSAERLAAATGAPTAWYNMGILATLTLAGLACHWRARR